jgi:hypothetical protein
MREHATMLATNPHTKPKALTLLDFFIFSLQPLFKQLYRDSALEEL